MWSSKSQSKSFPSLNWRPLTPCSGTGRTELLGDEDLCSAMTLLLDSGGCCGGVSNGCQDKMLLFSYIKKERKEIQYCCFAKK